MRPTKFDLMRAGRLRALRLAQPQPIFLAQKVSREEFAAQYETAPAAPFMEFEGGRYIEAPEEDENETCNNCAFRGRPSIECFAERHASVERAAKAAFGGSCIERSVIYIRAA